MEPQSPEPEAPVGDDSVNRWEEPEFSEDWSTLPTSVEWLSPRQVMEPLGELWSQSWPVLIGIALLLGALGQFVAALAMRLPGGALEFAKPGDLMPLVVNFALAIPLVALAMVCAGAVAVVATAVQYGRPVGALEVLRLSFSRAGPLLVIGGMVGAVSGLLMAWPSSFYSEYLRSSAASLPTPDPTSGLLFYGVFVIVFLAWLGVRLACVAPALLVDERDDAISRSWTISGRFQLSMLLVLVPAMAVSAALMLGVPFLLRPMHVPSGLVDLLSLVAGAIAPLLPMSLAAEAFLVARARDENPSPPPLLDRLPPPTFIIDEPLLQPSPGEPATEPSRQGDPEEGEGMMSPRETDESTPQSGPQDEEPSRVAQAEEAVGRTSPDASSEEGPSGEAAGEEEASKSEIVYDPREEAGGPQAARPGESTPAAPAAEEATE
jgi:hypothetical protein